MTTQVISNQNMISASTFLTSVGVNAHIGFGSGGYDNSSLVLRSLSYLGIDTVRDHFTAVGTQGAAISAVAAAGMKFDFVVGSDQPAGGSVKLADYVNDLTTFRALHADGIFAVEGLNEVNIQTFSYNDSSSIAAAGAYQKVLYEAIKGSTALHDLSVINLSIAMESDPSYRQLGDLGLWSDFGNSHGYAATNVSADTQIEASMVRARDASSGNPVIVSETGYTTLSCKNMLSVSESVQAKLTLSALLDAFENGSSKTFLYELLDSELDPNGPDTEHHFGLFYADGTPKMVATAIHNLSTILSYSDPLVTEPAVTSTKLDGLPSDGHSMMLSKPDGAYDIILWRDALLWNNDAVGEFEVAAVTVTVDLGGPQQTVYVYDPINGTAPYAVYHDVSQISVPVSDRPLIVEVGSRSAATEMTMTVAPDLVTTTGDLVASIDRLSATSGLQSITLTDGSVLAVSTTVTMRDIITHYGDILSKIKGGYTFLVTTLGDGWRLEQTFDEKGALLSTADKVIDGRLLTFQRITAADGTVSELRYTAGTLVQSIVTGADGAVTNTSYDPTTGKLAWSIAKAADGELISTTYSDDGIATQEVKRTDGVVINDSFDAAGLRTGEVLVDATGKRIATKFDTATGDVAERYIQNADGTAEATSYNIVGQSYTQIQQWSDKSGQVVKVALTHKDGTFDSVETIDNNGTKTYASYNAAGLLVQTVALNQDGAATTIAYNAVTGAVEKSVVKAATGVITTTAYSDERVTSLEVMNTDGSRTVDSYGGNGAKAGSVVVDATGTWTTRRFDPNTGEITRLSVERTDGSGETVDYHVIGQSYTTQRQVWIEGGKITSVTRTHSDGSLDYTETNSADGTRLMDFYDTAGTRTAELAVASDGSQLSSNYDTAGRLTSAEATDAAGTTILSRDDVNARTKVSDLIAAVDDVQPVQMFAAVDVKLSDVVLDTTGTDRVANGYARQADLHGDGHSDLWWRNTDGTFTTWDVSSNQQEIEFQANAYVNGSVSNDWQIKAAFDFNGDGTSDILWRNAQSGTFTIWGATGSGFAANVYVDGSVSNDWQIAVTGDFNGDGKDDLLWRNTNSGTFTEWQSTGSGFAANVYVNGSVSNDWVLAGAADFDGDGKDDLLWRNKTTGTFTEWQSTGNGFTPNVYVDASVTDTSWRVAALADFNGDGRDDILWRNANSGTFTEWQSTGSGFTANAYVDGSVSSDWQTAQLGDFNDDGKADILWRNTADGAFSIWQSNGNGFDRNVVFNSSVSTTWSLQGHNQTII